MLSWKLSVFEIPLGKALTAYLDNNNCPPSFLRSLCEIGGDCFGPRNFSEGAQLLKKNTEVQNNTENSHNDENKDGAKLLLSLITDI